MIKKIAIGVVFALALASAAEAQTPRKGGTIRMTAPYGSSFSSMDIHTTPRAQDEIYAKALHRSLYIWDSAKTAGSGACQSGQRLRRRPRPHLQAARRRLLPSRPQDDGRRHHLVLQSHHGRQEGVSRCALCPPDQGRGRGREGPGQVDLRSEEDRRFHARDDADREGQSGLLFLHRRRRRSIQPTRPRKRASFKSRSASGRSSSSSTCRARALVAERWEKFYKPGKPYADKIMVLDHGRGAGARRRVPQQGDRHLDPRARAVRRLSADPASRAPSSRSPRCSPATWA